MRARTCAALAALALIALAIAGGVLALSGGGGRAAPAPRPAASTARVQRRTLTATISEAGVLTYRARPDGLPYTVITQARGTYTELPATGQVVAQGRVLYRVNDRPVVLLRGATPAYRTLSIGATGPDVAELNADLVALGDASRRRLDPRSAAFGPATAAAVKKLQAARGMGGAGTLALGQVVFEPAAVRVTALLAQPGSTARPGEPVLQATSPDRQVQLALDASQQTDVAVGNRVSITLPDNHTTAGIVTSVAKVATCAPSAGDGPSAASGGAQTDACSSGGSGSGTPTINVDIAFTHPAASGRWDRAPVQVGITTATVKHALVVPVTALVARSGGGCAVEVAEATNRLVRVSLGLFDDADGLVQVSGPELAAGQRVVVPST
jgi:peptidoglycan hydrolase-like protein with peptidoglycan-binding domain